MYSNFEAALQSLEFVAALNKMKMIEWLATLQIDYEAIPIRSFVHQQFDFCVAIYELLCTRLDCDPKVLFTSRRWFHRDTQNCEHGLVRCLCFECVSLHAKCDVAGCDKVPTFNFPNVQSWASFEPGADQIRMTCGLGSRYFKQQQPSGGLQG